MGHQLYNHPRQLNLSTSLAVLDGAQAFFFVSGTSTPATVYQNAALTTPHAVPVEANAAGVFPPIYLDSGVLYKVELQDKNGAVLSGYPVDPCNDLLPQSGNTLTQVTGTNTIEGTLSPDQALVAGLEITVIPVATNTAATTLELNSSGAVLDVLSSDGSACTGGELVIGIPATLKLDSGGDDWIITNPQVVRSRGLEVGYRFLNFQTQSGSYTILQTDNGKLVKYGGAGGHTYTFGALIDGTNVMVENTGSGTLTIAVSGGTTLSWLNGSGSVSTGSRTLAVGGTATIYLCDTTFWRIVGVGLS